MIGTEHDSSPDLVEIRRQRFDLIKGQPAWFYAADAMVNPFGDKPGVPAADYQRLQPDSAKEELVVHGIVEGTVQDFTPQYLRDPTEEVWLVELRHTEISGRDGHIKLPSAAPRSYVRIDRIRSWYESLEDAAPDQRAAAA